MNVRASGKESLVQYHRQGHVGTITLNRPDKHNAMNPPLWSSLDDAIAAAEGYEQGRDSRGQSSSTELDSSDDREINTIRRFPNARELLWRCLLFPLYPSLARKEVQLICRVLGTLP